MVFMKSFPNLKDFQSVSLDRSCFLLFFWPVFVLYYNKQGVIQTMKNIKEGEKSVRAKNRWEEYSEVFVKPTQKKMQTCEVPSGFSA